MPETFGRYELRELLGRGGMGEVYRAFDSVRDREVALKLLPPHLAGDEAFQARFRREARLAARLNDPHIIPIHDFGEIDGRLFLDMRLVQGEDLSASIERRGRLPVATAVSIVAQAASALDAAHDGGLVHRDVKPSNILIAGMPDATDPRAVDATPFAYLVDFGIARSDAQDGTALTSTATTLGTVAYLAPERIGGEQGDRRVDVYALACVLFETVTGRKPFDGEMFAIMYGHVNSPVPTLRALVPDAPAGLDEVIRRGMAKDPAQRYPSAGALARDAQAALRAASVDLAPLPPQPPRERPGDRPGARPGPASDDRATQRGRVTPMPAAPPPPPVHRPPTGPDARPEPPRPGQSRPEYPRSDPSAPLPGGGGGRTRRRAAIAAVIAVLVVAGGIGAVVALSGGDPVGRAAPSTGPVTGVTTPDFPSDSGTGGGSGPATSAPLKVATGPTPAWTDFASFATLVGTSDGDTAHSFLRASCTLRSAGTDASVGILGKVECTVPSSTVAVRVARFGSAAATAKYLGELVDDSGYAALPWAQRGVPRGVRYSSPSDSATVDITSTVCAMPTYLVQFTSTEPAAVPPTRLRDEFWNEAAFPNAVPAACAGDYRSASTLATEPGITSSKPTLDFSAASLPAFLRRGTSGLGVTTAAVGTGRESIVFTQKGSVTFYGTRPDVGVTMLGASNYPVDSALGAPRVTVPEGQVFTGMSHATFVLRGTFTTDGAGNAIAYTTGSKGWGAIKAKSNGNLEPSGSGIGSDRIGLAEDFGYSQGRLETIDCSSELPISDCSGNDRVFKYWRWSGTEFVLAGRAGLPR